MPNLTYEQGVLDALSQLTFQEAVACGFDKPYTEVTANSPLKKLFELRKKKFLGEEAG
jgi:hypothetical protein